MIGNMMQKMSVMVSVNAGNGVAIAKMWHYYSSKRCTMVRITNRHVIGNDAVNLTATACRT